MTRELIDITVTLEHETDAAWLVNDGSKSVWIPKSQAELEPKGPVFELTLPVWLATKKGLT